jgi:high-affinity nickel permease
MENTVKKEVSKMTFDSVAVSNILLACIAVLNVVILTVVYEYIKTKKAK